MDEGRGSAEPRHAPPSADLPGPPAAPPCAAGGPAAPDGPGPERGTEDGRPPSRPSVPPNALRPEEAVLWRWTNLVRRDAGLPPLRLHAALLRAARAKCREMAAARIFSHQGVLWPDARALQQAFGVRLRVMGGENLACHRDLATAFTGLVTSPVHRANMLHPEHDVVGIAVEAVRPAGVAVCQEFGGA